MIFIKAQEAINAAKCATNSILKLVFTHFVAVEEYGRRLAGFLRWQHSEDIMRKWLSRMDAALLDFELGSDLRVEECAHLVLKKENTANIITI